MHLNQKQSNGTNCTGEGGGAKILARASDARFSLKPHFCLIYNDLSRAICRRIKNCNVWGGLSSSFEFFGADVFASPPLAEFPWAPMPRPMMHWLCGHVSDLHLPHWCAHCDADGPDLCHRKRKLHVDTPQVIPPIVAAAAQHFLLHHVSSKILHHIHCMGVNFD